MDSTGKKRISSKEGATDDPPAFEEMMRTPPVFFMFLSYLIDQMATENLFFLQYVRLYRNLKRPQEEIDFFGRKIMNTFCLPGAPAEVNISAETRSSLSQAFVQPSLMNTATGRVSPSVYTPTLFDIAYGEIRTLLEQPFSAWVATNEWKKREILNSMRRLQPPSFSTVLSNKTLCSMFISFLRENVTEDSDEFDSFMFCVDAEKFRSSSLKGNHHQANDSEQKTRSRKMSDAPVPVSLVAMIAQEACEEERIIGRARTSSEALAPLPIPTKDEDLIMGSSETVNLEKIARSIVRKHRLPKKSKQLSYRLHLSAQYDRLVSQWARTDIFMKWQKSKQWTDVPFKDPVTLRQSKNSAGFLEYPTLPATIVSLFTDPHRSGNGLGTLFRYIMNYSSYPKDLDFMEAILKFRKKFSSDTVDKDEMVEAASNIFNSFLVPVKLAEVSPHSPCPQFLSNPLCCRASPGNSPYSSPLIMSSSPPDVVEAPLVNLDPVLVNELRSILWSSAKTKVHVDMFRRAGTFVFYRAEQTWFRELRASFLWVNREYENAGEQTDRVSSYLGDFSVIESVTENQPQAFLYDDIFENSSLYMKFTTLVPSTRKPILDALDRISVFRMKPVQTLHEARVLRSFIKSVQSDNIVVRKLVKNMKYYLDMESVAAPFHDDGNSSPPSEGKALVNSAIFDFIRSSMHRQLLAECGEKFIALRMQKKIMARAHLLNFYKYVQPLHEIEQALLTKPVVQSQCGPVSSGGNSKNSSGNSGVRTPLISNVMPLPITLDGTAEGEDIVVPTAPPVSKRNTFLGFLRNKQRHSPLVRHVRAPSAMDPLPNRDFSPQVEPVVSPSKSAMTIPSFEEVLGSTYFRKMLTDYYFCRVDEDESNAWDDLTGFYSKYSKADDTALARSQEAAVKQAKSLIEANREFLSSFADELEKNLKSNPPMTVTANFFRKAERTLFSKAYDAFVQHLVQNGWKLVPIAVGTDDDLMYM